jgi:hypothetical protein
MRRNFDLSTGLVGLGAVAVLISLFLDWYQPGLTAWHVFELADWVLAALAVAALVIIVTETISAEASSPKLAWICGIVAFVVIAQLIDPPPAASGQDRAAGAWVALAGSAAMVAGAVLALAQISVTIDVAERRRRTAAVDARDGGAGAGSAGAGGAGGAGSGGAGAAGSGGPGAGRAGAGGRGAAGDPPSDLEADEASGLWQRPGGEPPSSSGPSVGGSAGPAEPDVAASDAAETRRVIIPDPPEADADRTQPFRTAQHPDEPT